LLLLHRKGEAREMEGRWKGDGREIKPHPPPSPRERELKSLTEKRHNAMREKAY